ncbi:MAG TPA: Gfo/Idh/MocA family oxidoreductase [Candidatus Binatia bacterium]|nr:Gfo/Idh/MocA family oxidoreductase [Candidatus Binatia bacterium]
MTAGDRAGRPKAPLRVGVVGVGALAIRGIVPHLVEPDVAGRVRLAALCDPVVERAADVASRHGIPHVFGSLDDLLAAGVVDAVTIASPIGLHFEQARAAIQAGVHVHVNKTMTTTVAEADELIDLARANDLRLVASPGEILQPQLARTRELIAAGAIGRVAWAMCGMAFGSYHEADEPERRGAAGGAIDPSWYFRKPGGGPMYDMTVYALHRLTSVLGPARRVTALSAVRIPERMFSGRAVPTEADDNTILLLDFGEGLFAVAYGTAAGTADEQLAAGTYYGTRGTIDGVLLNGEPFDFPGREATLVAPVTDWEAQNRALPHVTGVHRDIGESHVFADIMQLVDSVLDDRPSSVTAEHARHVIDIIESGYRAAATGRTQDLTTTFDPSVSAPG